VDIVTTLLDHLYTNGIKMMFDSEFDTYDNILVCIIMRETHIYIYAYIDILNLFILYIIFIKQLTTMKHWII